MPGWNITHYCYDAMIEMNHSLVKWMMTDDDGSSSLGHCFRRVAYASELFCENTKITDYLCLHMLLYVWYCYNISFNWHFYC